MYEYECKSCHQTFDLLRGINQPDTDVTCSLCGSPQVERRLSVFAPVAKEGSAAFDLPMASGDGGSCCSGGACGCNFSSN
jgi:putative FmdB family regulatory protein